MKETLLISFSGGRTSAYMTKWCLENLSDRFEMLVVFSNTGKERIETLDFINECDKKFNFNTIWIEPIVNPTHGKGMRAKAVNYHTADREGKVFESHIAKYGISNVATPMCTRDMKDYTIHSYMKQKGYTDYYTAIGIRVDEFDRIHSNKEKLKFIYPFVELHPQTKYDVNRFWSNQDFDLELKSYEGNCDMCYKKSLRKILTLAVEKPHLLDWWGEMEKKYENYLPPNRQDKNITYPIRFFRNNLSVSEIREMAKTFKDFARDESKDVQQYEQLSLFNLDLDSSGACSESCEVFHH